MNAKGRAAINHEIFFILLCFWLRIITWAEIFMPDKSKASSQKKLRQWGGEATMLLLHVGIGFPKFEKWRR
ncbi:MAG: hypothetical protein C4308_10665 [Chitinophagaceae bacterium]